METKIDYIAEMKKLNEDIKSLKDKQTLLEKENKELKDKKEVKKEIKEVKEVKKEVKETKIDPSEEITKLKKEVEELKKQNSKQFESKFDFEKKQKENKNVELLEEII